MYCDQKLWRYTAFCPLKQQFDEWTLNRRCGSAWSLSMEWHQKEITQILNPTKTLVMINKANGKNCNHPLAKICISSTWSAGVCKRWKSKRHWWVRSYCLRQPQKAVVQAKHSWADRSRSIIFEQEESRLKHQKKNLSSLHFIVSINFASESPTE